jgi:hypothetical protein
MPKTPDRFPGESIEDQYYELTEHVTPPTDKVGTIAYVNGSFYLVDSSGNFDPRSGGGGITEAQHKVLRQLIHFVNDGPAEGFPSGCYREILPAGSPFPTSVIWWESDSKLKKIVEKTITRTGAGSSVAPTPIVWVMYDTDGSTALAELSDAIVYSGPFELSRTRTITVY